MPSTEEEEDNEDDWEKDDGEEEEREEEQQHQGDFVEEGLRQRRVWRGEENNDAFNATTTTSVDDDANVNVNEDDESGREEEEEEGGGVEQVNAIMNGFRLAVESFERSGNAAALAEYTAQLRESFPAELRDLQQEHLLEHVLPGDAGELRAGITRMRGNLNVLSRLVPSTDATGLQGLSLIHI